MALIISRMQPRLRCCRIPLIMWPSSKLSALLPSKQVMLLLTVCHIHSRTTRHWYSHKQMHTMQNELQSDAPFITPSTTILVTTIWLRTTTKLDMTSIPQLILPMQMLPKPMLVWSPMHLSIRCQRKANDYGHLSQMSITSTFLNGICQQPLLLLLLMVEVKVDVELSSRNGINWLRAYLHDIKPPDHSSDQTTEDIDTPEPQDGEELDFIDSVCNQFDVDLETLYAHAAKWHTDVNKKRHKHWKPPKGSTLPLSDIQCMMADKKEIDINGAKYSIKKANATSHASNITINGVT